ncbi:peptidoglycan DD-metalloendopeptidase family protein [uncultured Kiloniella sp.]|uniref:peptidoglycan DD-metalloendopeptidase family protein n=1 Tax=uncultured Kiloniella sp. TaxID=1133091 RepID=UPI0026149B9E|nr:peptidoglycan DD-metalloendopeptidase family protein [uncultured Kiloniella sp.]
MFNRTSLPTLKLGFLLLSAGLYGCTINPSSFPTTTQKSTPTQTVYSYPPSILPKRKPTPPSRPSTAGQTTGRVAGVSIPALLPENIPLPKRNPRRQVRQSSSTTVIQKQARATSQPVNNQTEISSTQYTVNRGDTVYSISRKRRVSIRELIILNRLSPPYKLLVGQAIKLPVSKEHVVIAGDTLYSISRRYGVETTALVKINKINPPYALYVGQRLNLPALRQDNVVRSASVSPSTNTPNITSAVPKTSTKTPVRSAIPASPKNFTGPVPKPLPRSFSNFLRPVKGKVISSFGAKEGGIHNDGINIAARRGTSVKAAENGVVVYAGSELKGFGQMLLIKHSDGWVTAYAHTDQLLVGRGQRVKRGQDIARVGSTGNVSKPQLHFEIRKGSEAVNPNKLLTN